MEKLEETEVKRRISIKTAVTITSLAVGGYLIPNVLICPFMCLML